MLTHARSWLFAPGHNPKLVSKVFTAGADEVILDLEDAVPPDAKPHARTLVADTLPHHRAWVRINGTRNPIADADLRAVAARAYGIRIPKVESLDDVEWVADRAPDTPLLCAIETAKGVLNAPALAAHPAVTHLALGGVDLQKDLGVTHGGRPLDHVRGHLVLACAAAGIAPPVDAVHPHLDDDTGLRDQAEASRELGMYGKSAIHPRQLATIHATFTPDADEIDWARTVLDAFDTAGGNAVQLATGEFVDLPVAERARAVLDRARATAR